MNVHLSLARTPRAPFVNDGSVYCIGTMECETVAFTVPGSLKIGLNGGQCTQAECMLVKTRKGGSCDALQLEVCPASHQSIATAVLGQIYSARMIYHVMTPAGAISKQLPHSVRAQKNLPFLSFWSKFRHRHSATAIS